MHPFHERLARIGLAAAAPYGFCLAGGYAVQVRDMLADALRAVRPFPPSAFEPYSLSEPDIDLLHRRLLDWADETSGRRA